MDLLINRLTVSILVAGCLVAWFLQLIAHSPISPSPLILQPSYKREGHLAKNNALQAVEKLGEGFLDRPEDTAVDSRGLIYTATQDGWVKRMHLNGSWENWKMVGLASIGLTVSKSGDVLVCTPGLGLLKVSDDQISLLASEIDGIPIRFRCLKHWIKREKLGSTEIFIENLPGGPDNIHIAADGRSYWIGLVGIRSRTLEFVYRYGILKHVFATYPNLLEWIGFAKSRAMVVKVGEEGEPIISLEDPNGKVMSFVTSAMEVGNYLYLGSVNANFLGRLSAPKFGD